MSSDLATRIADARKKAEVAKEAAEIVRKNPHRSDWFEEGEYRQATPPDLFIEMADEIDRLKAQLEKARGEIKYLIREQTALRTAARVHAELAEKEKE